MRFLLLLLLVTCARVCAAKQLNGLPDGLLGVWSGNFTKGVMGPRSSELKDKGHGFLVVSQPDTHGNIYMKQDDFNQLFLIQNELMQYCAHEPGPFGLENPYVSNAPFEIVPGLDDQEVNFCWRGPRLPSHKANCTGCDCAHWNLRLDNGTLKSTLWQSPPVVHVQMTLVKTGEAPPAENLSKAWPCDVDNTTARTGNVPIAPGAKQLPMHTFLADSSMPQISDFPTAEIGAQGEVKNCVMLNEQHNVRLSYTVPEFPCMPCNVSFALSMDTPQNSRVNYVAVGFKDNGVAYANSSLLPYNMSNYWGMSGDNVGDLSGRIMVGYIGNGGTQCAREMRSDSYVGAPTDALEDSMFHHASVTAGNGQTRVEFTAPFHAGKDGKDINWLEGSFGRNRFMWAMGTVGGDGGCSDPIQYHDAVRGVCPLNFPLYAQACHCSFPQVCVSPWVRPHWMLNTDLEISV